MLGLALAAVLLAPYADPAVHLTFADPRIRESSGLVAASRADGVLFTHNDSGDVARFFAVGGDGQTLATYVLPGQDARDWEDIARGPDEQGRSSLWLGDIGDNSSTRDRGILVHRVPEPDPAAGDQELDPTSFRLVYPDRPRDAEALLVDPRDGRLYVVAKAVFGDTRVFAAPERLDPDGRNELEQVAAISLRATGTPGGPDLGQVVQVLVTAGDVSPDGDRVALRTYTDLYEWQVPGEGLAAAFDEEPVVTPLPPTAQGEGLAYTRDGGAVLTSTEGEGAPVHRLVRAAQASPSATPVPQRVDRSGRDWVPPAIAAGSLLLALGVVGALLAERRAARRRRRRQGSADAL